MSVIYNGKEYRVKNKQGFLMLNLSRKKIKKISEVKGLESLKELQVLNLSNNSLSMIEGLETLRNLMTLELDSNEITEIKGLETLKNLKLLNLARNSISEIKGLDTLTNLEELHLEHNKILEIKGMDNLIKLRELYLTFNEISQVKSFLNKDHIINLSLIRNPIYYKLKFIPGISNTEKLENYTRMSNKDIEEVVEEGRAKKNIVFHSGREYKAIIKNSVLNLDLSAKRIKNISEIEGLKNLTKLQVLNLNDNRISEIKGLETLINLQTLLLENNLIITLNGLDSLINLKTLNLFSCKIHQIESFANKDNLKELFLGNNPLYKNLKNAFFHKKMLSRMTEEERKNFGVNPIIWEIVRTFKGKLRSKPSKKHYGPDIGAILGIEGAVKACIEMFTVVAFLATFISLTWVK